MSELAPGASIVYLDVPNGTKHSPGGYPRPSWWSNGRGYGLRVWLACGCGQISSLSSTHQVDCDGRVQPGILCGQCGLKKHVKLIDWGLEYVELVAIEEEPS